MENSRINLRYLRLIALVSLSLFGTRAVVAQCYKFTVIAHTEQLDFEEFNGRVSIGHIGEVAFRARLNDGRSGIFIGNGLFTPSEVVATVLDPEEGDITLVFNPCVTGVELAYGAHFCPSGGAIFRTGCQPSHCTIADTRDGVYTSLGGHSCDEDTGGVTYVAWEGDEAAIFLSGNRRLLSKEESWERFVSHSYNGWGAVAFTVRLLDGGTALYIYPGGNGPFRIADTNGEEFAHISRPAINFQRTVAFGGGPRGGDGIYVWNGEEIVKIIESRGDCIGAPDINDDGTLTYIRTLGCKGGTLRVVNSDGVKHTVVADWCSVGSFMVSGFSHSSANINDAGQIAFTARIGNDDEQAVIRADPIRPDGDLDFDDDVDIEDFHSVHACLGGPDVPIDPLCACTTCVDFDGDGDVDLRDFAIFQSWFTG